MTNRTFYYYRDHRSQRFNTSPGHAWEGKMTAAEMDACARTPTDDPTLCGFCERVQLLSWQNEVDLEDANKTFTFRACPHCGWWNTRKDTHLKYITGYDSSASFYSYMSSLEEHFAIWDSFGIADDTAPLDEVANVLLSDWHYARHISAQVAQDLVLQVFKNYLNCEVYYYDEAVYAPDGGIDFVLVRTDTSRIAFQVKRRQTDRAESIRPVREFIGALAKSPYREGMFVTTARLSDYAKTGVDTSKSNLENKGLEVTLVDGARLRNILKLHRSSDRSLAALTEIVPASGWRNLSSGTVGLHIVDVLEQTRAMRTGR